MQNHTNLAGLIAACARRGDLRLGTALHAAVIKLTSLNPDPSQTLLLHNSLISLYAKSNDLPSASAVFAATPTKDAVSHNSLLSALLIHNLPSALAFFHRVPLRDHASFTTLLSAFASPDRLPSLENIHAFALLSGFFPEVSVGNATVTAYFRCGSPVAARKVFDEMGERNVVTWTAMVSGLHRSGVYKESLRVFGEMRRGSVPANCLTYSVVIMSCAGARAIREGRAVHALVVKAGCEKDLFVESGLMDLYSKCGVVEEACCIFESAEEVDEVSHTVVLTGLAQNGMEDRAMRFFVRMVREGVEIDASVVSAVLGAFGAFAPFGLGRQIHGLVVKRCYGSNVFVGNGLVDMYSKCGDLVSSAEVFGEMKWRNLVSWNTIIAGFARHGRASEALESYEKMRVEGVEPTDVTFLSLLHVCSHVGAVEKGMEFFTSMTDVYKIKPRTEHYACVVDMLGRAGRLEEAKTFIEGLQVKPSAVIWQSLLGACGIHGDSETGKYAAEQLSLVAPDCPAPYVLLANMHSSEGEWKEKAGVLRRMKEAKVKKETGMSWIEIGGDVHTFVVGFDGIHLKAKNIYEVLHELFMQSRDEESVLELTECNYGDSYRI